MPKELTVVKLSDKLGSRFFVEGNHFLIHEAIIEAEANREILDIAGCRFTLSPASVVMRESARFTDSQDPKRERALRDNDEICFIEHRVTKYLGEIKDVEAIMKLPQNGEYLIRGPVKGNPYLYTLIEYLRPDVTIYLANDITYKEVLSIKEYLSKYTKEEATQKLINNVFPKRKLLSKWIREEIAKDSEEVV